jgi:integrase
MHILSTAEEIDYFQRAARFPDLHDAGQLMINLGLSETEAVALAKAHVDLAGSGLRIRSAEGNPERVLPVTAGCRLAVDLPLEEEFRRAHIAGRRCSPLGSCRSRSGGNHF